MNFILVPYEETIGTASFSDDRKKRQENKKEAGSAAHIDCSNKKTEI